MRKSGTIIFLIAAFVFTAYLNSFSQTTLISATGNGGFETGTTFAANGWTVVNTPPAQTNQWYCGNGAAGFTGARCAYIGTGSNNNNYNVNNASTVHFYRDVAFPAGQPSITLSFSWKGYGESGYDFLRVYLVSPSTTIIAGSYVIYTSQIGSDYSLSSSWQTATISIPCTAAGTTQRLVFSWINDASLGTMPAGAIDNISLVSNAASSCATAMGSGVITVPSLPYNSGAGTTCGAGNDLTPTNTPVCGSTSYLTGEDRVWIFTPTTTGAYSFTLSAPLASYTGLTLYQNCPVGLCSGPAATCIAYDQSYLGDKSFCATLTAGVTYYLVLDSWASPTCNSYSNLSIIPVAGSTCTSLIGAGLINVPSLPYNSGPGSTCGATNNLTPTNTATCGSSSYLTGEDQVFVFTPTATGQITITLDAPAASYTGLMLYSGCPVGGCGPGPGTCVDFVQDYLGSKTFCVPVTSGVTYYLVLDSYASPVCNNYNSLSISAVVTGNAGATCASAISITVPYNATSQSTACKGNDYLAGTAGICNGGFAYGNDIVYSFTVSASQCIGISISGATSNDITYAFYQGCPGGGGGICIGSGGGATLGALSGSVIVPAAGTYYLIIDSQFPSTSVGFNFSITSYGAGAPNDRPYQAQTLPFNVPVSGNNSCSSNADEPASAPSCFGPAGTNSLNTVWYSFVAPATGCVKLRTSIGTLTNTQIAVYGPAAVPVVSGNGSSLAPVGCNDDLPPCGFNTYPSSELNLSGLTPGMLYYVMVDGYAGATGSFTLFLMDAGVGCSLPFPPSPGQDCSLAFPVCKSNINVPNPGPQAVGSNCEFTSGVNCLASGERGSYWYTINIVSNGFLEFNIVPNDWPGAPSTSATDYDFAVWKTKTAGVPGPANCSNLGSVAPVSCNYSGLGVTGCNSATVGNAPAAYPGFGAAYEQRITVAAGDQYLLNVSNFSNSTSGFALNFTAASPVATAPVAGGALIWTGTLSSDWHNAENWGGCAVPGCMTNVSISPSPVNQPSITGTTAVCGTLDIAAGATLTLQANTQLKICSNFVNNGTLNAQTNSTLLLQSDSVLQNQSMTGSMTGVSRLWNLTINKPVTTGGNTVTLNNDLDNAGNFLLGSVPAYAGGIFNASGKYHKVAKNFTVYYSGLPNCFYNSSGGTLEFNGTATQDYFNPGQLNNVVMNHTGTGVRVFPGGTGTMSINGILSLNAGKIITTGTNIVRVLNPSPAACTPGNTTSYVETILMRNFSPAGGSYDFPVGEPTKGYQRINLNFGTFNDRTSAEVSFVNTVVPTPVPFLGPECISASYDQVPLNNGRWTVSPLPVSGVAPYSVTAYNTNYSNAMPGYTLMTKYGAGAWGLAGNCVAGSPITAVQRTNLSMLTGPTLFATAQSTSPLPVELVFFDATAKHKSIHLNWITSSEINNQGFEIWRSTSPPDFTYIGFVNGHGNTSNTHEYKFEDRNVLTDINYYYKLRQIDFDGMYKFTDVVMARLSGRGFSVSAVPNPYMISTSILLNLEHDAEVKLSVFSALGQEVAILQDGFLKEGKYELYFDSGQAGFGQGVYTVNLVIDGESHYLKLLQLE